MTEKASAPCKYGDPLCPCQDGDMCHYEGPNRMNVPPEYFMAALRTHAETVAQDARRKAFEEAEKITMTMGYSKPLDQYEYGFNCGLAEVVFAVRALAPALQTGEEGS